MLSVGGDFSPSVKAALQPGPRQRAACAPARKAAGRQEAAGREEEGGCDPHRPPSRSPPRQAGLSGGGASGREGDTVCGFPEVWGLSDFRGLCFLKNICRLGQKSWQEGAPPCTRWAPQLHPQH